MIKNCNTCIAEFSVPAMFSDSQISFIDELNSKYGISRKISEVYGSIPYSPIGSIRPSNTIPIFDIDNLHRYINLLKKSNIGFNYIMNSVVSDGLEYDSSGRKTIVDFVGKLVEAGISSITLSAPYMIKLIHYYFPSLSITTSICAGVDSIQRKNDYESLGSVCVVPEKDVNRDFLLLKKMASENKAQLKLLCTTPCSFKCSDLWYHMNISSVRDNCLKDAFGHKENFMSHTSYRCQKKRLSNPVEYLRSPWIRPEDITLYQGIGINLFKLDGRDKSESYNNEVCKAYISGSYEGNLLYLMADYFPKDEKEFFDIVHINVDYWKLCVYVDNKKLEGFINGFIDVKNRCQNGCVSCSYCSKWAEKVITIYKENTDQYLDLLSRTEIDNLSI